MTALLGKMRPSQTQEIDVCVTRAEASTAQAYTRMGSLVFLSFLLLVASSHAVDIDLLASADIRPSNVDAIQPPGSVIVAPGRNGTTKSICLVLDPTPSDRFQLASADESTIRTAIGDFPKVPLQSHDFGFSTLVKFDKFRPGRQTLFSIQSADGTVVYLRVNIVATAAATDSCWQCMKVTSEIQWRSKTANAGDPEITTPFDAELLLDDLDWHFIYVDVNLKPSGSDLSSALADITMYVECNSEKVRTLGVSQFLMTPPSSAIVLFGMGVDKGSVINRVRGCLERPLFRIESYDSAENRREYCDYTPCVNCREDPDVISANDESGRLQAITAETKVKLADCEKSQFVAVKQNCFVSGCTFDDGTKGVVGDKKVIARGAGNKVCVLCKCVAIEDVTCYDYCHCTEAGTRYYHGQEFYRSKCERCTCEDSKIINCVNPC